MKHSLRLRLCLTEFFQPLKMMIVRMENAFQEFYLVGSAKEWEFGLEILIDFVERQFLGGHRLDGHDDQGDVAVRGLLLPSRA